MNVCDISVIKPLFCKMCHKLFFTHTQKKSEIKSVHVHFFISIYRSKTINLKQNIFINFFSFQNSKLKNYFLQGNKKKLNLECNLSSMT